MFTESKETAEYLGEELNKTFPDEVLVFTGSSAHHVRESIIDNFDPRAFNPKDDYRILITTEVLSEGVSLHRSQVVINYDIPWNPTRLIQQVGRINRVDTEFDKIYIFNFFPTEQSNDIIKLEETAKAKIEAFINLLGADARILTEEEELESHELFGRLVSKKIITGEEEEEESELKYLKIIQDIRDRDPDLFDRIKRLPKKARTAREFPPLTSVQEPSPLTRGARGVNHLLTYFRKGKLNKFIITDGNQAQELDFMTSAWLLECDKRTEKKPIPGNFYDFLQQNEEKFKSLTSEEEQSFVPVRSGKDSTDRLIKTLKAVSWDLRSFTEKQETYFKKVISRVEEGALPKQTVNTVLKALEQEIKAVSGQPQPLKILALLEQNIPDNLLKPHVLEVEFEKESSREVILSEYFIKK